MRLAKLLAKQAGFLQTPPATEILSRRKLLMGGSALAAMFGSQKTAEAAPSSSANRFLVNRLTYGWNQQEQLLADQLGYYGYLEYHLNHTAIDDSAVNQRTAPYYFMGWVPYQLITVPQSAYVVHQLVETNLIRAIHSRRQLYQRMVEFWSDHFHIDINNSLGQWLKIVDDRDVARAHALGMFGDMLLASAKSPLMSMYLNNDLSVVGNPNENYARELMELHTMGVDGGYTQQDVVEVARCFTGWAYHGTDQGLNMLKFHYYDYKHDQGPKVVLGQQIPANGGMNDGLIVLDILLHHPSTANYIAKKLCTYFYSYSPPQSLINSVAATFSSTNGNIKECVRTLFSNADPAGAEPKIKRPYHLIVSAFRASGADIIDAPYDWRSEVRDQMALGGHSPYSWMTPDGYPDKLDFWANMILPRWNFATRLGSGNFTGVTFDVNAFFAGANDVGAMVKRINQTIFANQMPQAEQDQISTYLSVNPTSLQRKREAVGLAIASPSFQWY